MEDFIIPIISSVVFVLILFWYIMSLRRIVPTNEVHIVQKTNKTYVYGNCATPNNGNSYYQIPPFIPKIGVVVTKLPSIVQQIEITKCKMFDKDGMEFSLNLLAFFRIVDFEKTATSIFTINRLKEQLGALIHNTTLGLMSQQSLEEIVTSFSQYNEQVTKCVSKLTKEWGVELLGQVQITEINDVEDGDIVYNIRQKQKSYKEIELKKVIAENEKIAMEAVLKAEQHIALAQQAMAKEVQLNKAEAVHEVAVLTEQKKQELHDITKETTEKEIEVRKVEVQSAEIEKHAAEIKSEINELTDNKDEEVENQNGEEII